MKKSIVFLILAFITPWVWGQTDTLRYRRGGVDIGFEIQGYPAGIIPTFTFNIYFSNHLALRLRIGGNLANRRDFSPYNDNERAIGFGGSGGLVAYFPFKNGNITVGTTIDLWNMWTRWKDDIHSSLPREGVTYTLVFQPWMNAGYLFNVPGRGMNLGATYGFGKEINVITLGESVGEGWMSSITLTMNISVSR